ncbi:hypothetical protein ACOSQ2_021293 [Xanthoceras sorbifolium]
MNQPQARLSRAAEKEAPKEQRYTIERASKLRAKPYDGSSDLEAALLWLDSVSKIYKVKGCTDEQRVLFSSFLMEDRTKNWWEALERLEQKSMSVTNYEEKFYELVWLVPFIQEDGEQRCKRFMTGLNSRIKIHLPLASQTHCGELVEATIKVERNATAITQGRPNNKRSVPSSS